MNADVRIAGICIKNFKNVRNGELSFDNNRKKYKASILGLYGQNGSGKTAMIDSIELLKCILCGYEIPNKFADYVNVDADYAELEYTFDINIDNESYPVVYKLNYGRINEIDSGNTENIANENSTYKVTLNKEIIKCQFKSSNGKLRMGRLIDTDTPNVFVPKSKYDALVGQDKETAMNLIVAKKLAQKTSRTFIFSKDLLNEISKRKNETLNGTMHYYSLLEALVKFGNNELFVINTTTSGLISMNAQPLVFKIPGKDSGFIGTIALPVEEAAVIPEDMYNVTKAVIKNMNIVLETIIPGLNIAVKDLGNQLMKNGVAGKRIELVSKKNSKEIALRYESEGIKKIVSILQLLVVVYNQKSITVAIDELDSGIFEYLLGELLKIISEKGKGQLIFTSHNLRPLETIDRGFVAFTTTNPDKRYIRFLNVKENNNLRDFYYRDIMLGEQNEDVYDITNNSEIALAFREAGESLGS